MFVTVLHQRAGVTIQLNDDIYPFTKEFDTHCEMSERPRIPKLQAPGQWPVYTYARNRIFHAEGDIIGTDMADYDGKRIALLNHILPPGTATQKFTGTLSMTDENGHTYSAAVNLVSYSVPVVPLYPGVGPYMFEWESDDPFVQNTATGESIYI